MQLTKGRHLATKNIVRYSIVLALAAVLLYFSFKGINWTEFRQGMSSCDFRWITASMFFGFLGFLIRAIRWQMLLKELEPQAKTGAAYRGVTIGNLANFAFPRIGEIVRCGVVANKKITFEGAVGTVVVERIWDLMCLCLFTLLFIVFSWNGIFGQFIRTQLFLPARGKIAVIIVAAALLVFIAGALLFVYLHHRRKKRRTAGASNTQGEHKKGIERETGQIHKTGIENSSTYIKEAQPDGEGQKENTTIWEKVKNFCNRLLSGISAGLGMKGKWLFILLTLLLWGSFWITSKTTIEAFPALSHLTWTDALFLMIVGSLGWAVPVQGGIGAYHFIVSLACAQIYATTRAQGIVFATISHESQAVIMILCGAVSLISFTYLKRKSVMDADNSKPQHIADKEQGNIKHGNGQEHAQ